MLECTEQCSSFDVQSDSSRVQVYWPDDTDHIRGCCYDFIHVDVDVGVVVLTRQTRTAGSFPRFALFA